MQNNDISPAKAIAILVIVVAIILGCGWWLCHPRKSWIPPEVKQSFPVPAGAVVGQIKGEHFSIILRNDDLDYTPRKIRISDWYLAIHDAKSARNAKGSDWIRGYSIVAPMNVIGEARAEYPLVDLTPPAVQLPGSPESRIEPLFIELPQTVKWQNKELKLTFEIPIRIRLNWTAPRR